MIVVNRADVAMNVSFDWASGAKVPPGEYRVFDVWQHAYVSNISVSPPTRTPFLHTELATHAHLAFRLVVGR